MNVRSLIFAVAALFVAVMTAIIAWNLMSAGQDETPTQAAPRDTAPKVLVAAKSLPIGHIIQSADVRWQAWPEAGIAENYIVEGSATPNDVAGKVVRVAIVTNQPIARDAIVGPGERGFLAAALTSGMRAVTVPVSATSGVGGFVFPGDRVDLLVTHDIDRGDAGNLSISETVLQNVRVLAVDQAIANAENQPRVGQTVTLEVLPKHAEKIAVMQRMGGISLSLRSLTDQGDVVTADNEIQPAMPTDTKQTYTTASEVSKFAAARRVTKSSPSPASRPAPAPRSYGVVVVRGNRVTVAETGAN